MSVLQSEHQSDGLWTKEHDLSAWRWLSSLPVAIYTCDRDGLIQSYNQAAVELWGREPRIGHDRWCGSWKVFRPDGTLLPLAEYPMAIAIREDRSVRGAETIIERPDGSRRIALPHPDPLRDEWGRCIGAVNMLVDLTPWRDAEAAGHQSDRRFSRFMRHLPGLAWIKDAHGRYIYANDAALKSFGRSREELYGRTDEEVFPADTAAAFRANDCTALASEAGLQTLEKLQHPDGVLHYSIVSKFPIPGGEESETSVGGVAFDITEQKLTEEALRESEERYRQLVRLLPVAVYTCAAPSGEITFYNDKAAELWGRSPQLGNAAERYCGSCRLWTPDGRRLSHDETPMAQTLIAGSEFRNQEVVIERPDGSRITVLVNIDPIRDSKGNVTGAINVFHDVTSHVEIERALRASEERYRSLVSVIADVPWMTDPHGRFATPQPAWQAFTGQSWDEHRGFGWEQAIHPDDREHVKEVWQLACREQTVYESHGRLWNMERQEYCYFVARATPVFHADGSVREWVGACTNVTVQREAEFALIDADRRKDEFLATLAHELRNPLAPIRSALELLRRKSAVEAEVEVHDLLDRQVKHLVRLVDDLLDLSRISRGTIELRPERVELSAVIRNALDTSRPLIDAAEHLLQIDLPSQPLWLDADPIRIAQVISNLLNNAAKYTNRGGNIWLSAARRGDDLVIRIRDTGIGIPAAELANVFNMFTQVHRQEQSGNSGQGIGLCLSQKLVRLHGGRIEVHSDGPGAGSEFTVYLPLAKSVSKESRPFIVSPTHETLSAANGNGHPPRVLIVDDNRDAANALGMLLSLMSAEVAIANDGPRALELLPLHRPSIILLDIGMPGMDGFEVARRVRSHPAGKGVKLVALTGWGQESDRYRIRESGFDQHLVKPADMAAIESLLTA